MYKVVEITNGKMIAGQAYYDYIGYHLVILVDGQGNEHVAIPEYWTTWEAAARAIGQLNGRPEKPTRIGHAGPY